MYIWLSSFLFNIYKIYIMHQKLWILLVLLNSTILFSQTTVPSQATASNFIGSWIEGVLNKEGILTTGPVKSHSGHHLSILEDSTVVLDNFDNVGLGFSRKGHWRFDSVHNKLTFVFHFKQEYKKESDSTVAINQTEVFDIIKSSLTSLVITFIDKTEKTTYMFLRR